MLFSRVHVDVSYTEQMVFVGKFVNIDTSHVALPKLFLEFYLKQNAIGEVIISEVNFVLRYVWNHNGVQNKIENFSEFFTPVNLRNVAISSTTRLKRV